MNITTRKKYSREFKLDAIHLMREQGYTWAEAARSLGVNANMLGCWIAEHEAHDGEAFRGNSPNKYEAAMVELKKSFLTMLSQNA